MTERIENLILENLIYDEDYTRKVLPFIQAEYFEVSSDRTIFKTIKKFVEDYNSVPTKAAVKIAIEDTKGLSQADYSHAIETVDTLEPRTQNKEWLLKRTEEYCKDRALVNSVMTAITVIDGSNTKLSKNAIPSMLQEALNVSFDKTIGHDYFDDADRRYDFYHLKEDRLPFDLEMFNKITCGGLPSKTLSAVLAGCVHPATKVKIRIRRK